MATSTTTTTTTTSAAAAAMWTLAAMLTTCWAREGCRVTPRNRTGGKHTISVNAGNELTLKCACLGNRTLGQWERTDHHGTVTQLCACDRTSCSRPALNVRAPVCASESTQLGCTMKLYIPSVQWWHAGTYSCAPGEAVKVNVVELEVSEAKNFKKTHQRTVHGCDFLSDFLGGCTCVIISLSLFVFTMYVRLTCNWFYVSTDWRVYRKSLDYKVRATMGQINM